ncbi:hypothetical protein MNQ95_08815 [Pseudoxanthomonas daejeonensis]|uniref:hypothetical protein n=1 Tax=Pseudoxanthomonas daejeonensis TaxID=266062 RepID=UPI001F546021|nr:hypothetical protein [Pseudoxanthomonas daejeonensis]UNK56277.1 hypothetical protein MNQ95_08815 [Pseudoxanthomonas daejeonensis]
MDMEHRPPLTFAVLEAKIEALPEGPISALNTPRWARHLALAGVIGMIAAFVPSLLVKWLPPQPWMVLLAQAGLVVTVAGFLPGLLRNLWVLVQDIRHHRAGLIAQFDHDVDQFKALATWLAGYPRETLESSLRYARMGHERLHSRLGMLLGGIDRLGLLPVLISLFVLLRNWQDLLHLPGWLAVLGLLAPFLWLIAWLGAEFSRRLQLYAFLLDEALRAEGPAD